MALDDDSRGQLERIIDRAVAEITTKVSIIRMMKPELLIKEESDFAMGVAFGEIITSFAASRALGRGRLTNEELKEAWTVIMKRAREIRDAIFKTG